MMDEMVKLCKAGRFVFKANNNPCLHLVFKRFFMLHIPVSHYQWCAFRTYYEYFEGVWLTAWLGSCWDSLGFTERIVKHRFATPRLLLLWCRCFFCAKRLLVIVFFFLCLSDVISLAKWQKIDTNPSHCVPLYESRKWELQHYWTLWRRSRRSHGALRKHNIIVYYVLWLSQYRQTNIIKDVVTDYNNFYVVSVDKSFSLANV